MGQPPGVVLVFSWLKGSCRTSICQVMGRRGKRPSPGEPLPNERASIAPITWLFSAGNPAWTWPHLISGGRRRGQRWDKVACSWPALRPSSFMEGGKDGLCCATGCLSLSALDPSSVKRTEWDVPQRELGEVNERITMRFLSDELMPGSLGNQGSPSCRDLIHQPIGRFRCKSRWGAHRSGPRCRDVQTEARRRGPCLTLSRHPQSCPGSRRSGSRRWAWSLSPTRGSPTWSWHSPLPAAA